MSNSERYIVSRMTRARVFRIRVYRLAKIVIVAVLTAVLYHLVIRHRVGQEWVKFVKREAAFSVVVVGL